MQQTFRRVNVKQSFFYNPFLLNIKIPTPKKERKNTKTKQNETKLHKKVQKKKRKQNRHIHQLSRPPQLNTAKYISEITNPPPCKAGTQFINLYNTVYPTHLA